MNQLTPDRGTCSGRGLPPIMPSSVPVNHAHTGKHAPADLRIVSLVPSETEVVAALGLESRLVGRSQECDFPANVRRLPVCSTPRIRPGGTSQEIDHQVREILTQGLSMYIVDAERLWALEPGFILAQTQCAVCAATPDDLQAALRDWPDPESRPRILSTDPCDLDEVWRGICCTGEALGIADAARHLVGVLTGRLARLQKQTAALAHPTVVNLEWVAPPMPAGNWMPELIHIAGGRSLLARSGQHSPRITWEALAAVDPDVILITPCGLGIDEGAAELEQLACVPQWTALRAVRDDSVYLVDGAHYFNRPGPRLVDSAEIVAEILHPENFDFGHRGNAWVAASERLTVHAR